MPYSSKPAYELFIGDVTRSERFNKEKRSRKCELCCLITIVLSLAMLGTSAYIFYQDGNPDLVGVSFTIAIVILVVTALCCYQLR